MNSMLKVTMIAGAAVAAGMAEGRVYTPADPVRVAEIAAALPEKPGGPTPYTEAEGKRRLSWANTLVRQPVRELPDELYLEFSRNGNRSHYEKAYYGRYSALYALVAAECLEKQGRFLPKIVAYLDACCAQRSWVWPAHDVKLTNFNNTRLSIDLISSDLALKFAEIIVALGDRLPPETVKKLRAEMNRRVFDLYRADCGAEWPWNGWFFGDANWTAVCHAGVVQGALLIVEDRQERARFVEAAQRGMKAFLTGFTPDGYCSEGMGYWEYGFGHYLSLGLAVRAATGGKIDLFRAGGERARAAAGYPFAFQIQADRSPNFADGGGNPSLRRRQICAEIWPDLAPSLTGALPLRSTFPDAQVFISRAPGARPFGVAVKGGHNAEFHNHNDVGSWTVMLDGEELAGDPGGEVYTRRTFSKDRYVSNVLNSFGHPVPRVAGKLQPAGKQFRGKVLKTDFTDARDTVVLDLAGAYDAKELTKLVRTTVFDRAARTFRVTDEIAFATPQALDVPIVTYCGVTRGADKTALTLVTKKGARAAVTVSAAGGDWEIKEDVIENPDRPSPKRLAVAFAQPVSFATVSFTLKGEK